MNVYTNIDEILLMIPESEFRKENVRKRYKYKRPFLEKSPERENNPAFFLNRTGCKVDSGKHIKTVLTFYNLSKF